MTTRNALLAAALMMMTAGAAHAIDCKRATSRIDQAVCQSPDLVHLDTQMGDLYSSLRTQVSTKLKPAFVAQQRAWIARRDSACATAEVACLTTQYRARIDELTALAASSNAMLGPKDDGLSDLKPVIVRGRWKATSLYDPAADWKPSPADLQRSLTAAKLPAIGGVVNTAPGKVCIGEKDCTGIGWFNQTVGGSLDGMVVSDELKLPKNDRFLFGVPSTRSTAYSLVPRKDKTVLAIFALCQPNDTNCRQAAEVWTPDSPDASITPAH